MFGEWMIVLPMGPVAIGVLAGLLTVSLGALIGFGPKMIGKSNKSVNDVVVMAETRLELLHQINKTVDNANWFTKWRIKRKMRKKGLIDCK